MTAPNFDPCDPYLSGNLVVLFIGWGFVSCALGVVFGKMVWKRP
jgi:hypothetical protein